MYYIKLKDCGLFIKDDGVNFAFTPDIKAATIFPADIASIFANDENAELIKAKGHNPQYIAFIDKQDKKGEFVPF